MKKSLLLTVAAILLFGIAQNFNGQETTQSHRQLPIGGNTVIERQSKMAQAPFFSRQEPNRWNLDQTLPYQQRMTMPLRQRDSRTNNPITSGAFARHELSTGVDTAWVRHYASEPKPGIDRAVDIAIDKSGNVVVTGYITARENGLDFYTIKYNASGSQLWAARYDGNSGDDVPIDLSVDAIGNIYVTGISGRGFSTVKYSASGEEQWIARYSRTDDSYSGAIHIAVDDSGNIYLTGAIEVSNTSMFFQIIKYDPSGKEEWRTQYEGQFGTGADVAGVAIDDSGNVFIAGSYSSPGEGIPDLDFLILKYNSTGVLQWAVRFNGPGNNSDWPAALAVDQFGNVYVTGRSTVRSADGSDYVTIKYDASGMQQWATVYKSAPAYWSEAPDIAVDSSCNVFVTGSSRGTDSYSDFITIKYNASGIEQWVAYHNGPKNSDDKAIAITLDRSGNVYVTGVSGWDDAGDFLTVKYNASGEEQWAAQYNGPDNTGDSSTSIAVDDAGNVYVTGAGDIHYSRGMPYELHCNYATVKYDVSGVEQWVAHYDGPGAIHASATDMAIDHDGNVYVTGSATIKYNTFGEEQWAVANGGYVIAVDGFGNAYVTGFGNGGGYITVKYNASGEPQWETLCKRDVVWGYCSLAVDGSGNVYVARGVDVSSSNSDYIIIKYDSSGNELWAVTYDGPAHFFDEANAVAVDDSGHVYVTGKSYGADTLADLVTIKYNARGEMQWVARYNGSANSWDEGVDIAIDDSSNVYVTGRTRSSTTGEDFVTIKYDAIGATQWIARYNGPQNNWDEATALVLDNAGNVYVTGLSNGYGDYATVKYNNSGVNQWVARYSSSGGSSYDFPYDLAVDASGNVYVTGFSIGSRDDADFTTIKYNASGVEQWIAQYNGPGNSGDEAWCVAVDDAGHVYVAGTSWGNNWSMMTTIKYTQTGTPVVMEHEPASLPKDFCLMQNYPNPFNPSTTIEFALPKSAFVTLKIYNLLGEKVATLIAEQRAAGIHKFNWDARGLASGVYWYRLEAGYFVQTKKLILIR